MYGETLMSNYVQLLEEAGDILKLYSIGRKLNFWGICCSKNIVILLLFWFVSVFEMRQVLLVHSVMQFGSTVYRNYLVWMISALELYTPENLYVCTFNIYSCLQLFEVFCLCWKIQFETLSSHLMHCQCSGNIQTSEDIMFGAIFLDTSFYYHIYTLYSCSLRE